jgi:hypothetical protein
LNDAVCAVAGTVYTFNITIPPDAPAGTFAMRARTNWTAPVTDPCDTYNMAIVLILKPILDVILIIGLPLNRPMAQ